MVAIVGEREAFGNMVPRKISRPVTARFFVRVVAQPEPDRFGRTVAHKIDVAGAIAQAQGEFVIGFVEGDFPEMPIELEIAEVVGAGEVVPTPGQAINDLPKLIANRVPTECLRGWELDPVRDQLAGQG